MKRSELTEFAVEEEGFKLKIKREGSASVPSVILERPSSSPFSGTASVPGVTSPNIGTSPAPDSHATQLQQPASPDKEEAGFAYIKSPMVGTFYASPSPESKSFVEIGSKVGPTSIVCIIEAMKIMNEIQAEVTGSISEVMVENAQPIEYGQRLFKVKIG